MDPMPAWYQAEKRQLWKYDGLGTDPTSPAKNRDLSMVEDNTPEPQVES